MERPPLNQDKEWQRKLRESRNANEYEARASRWLADANEQAERGNKAKAEKLYDKAQYWLDKANVARQWN